MNRADEQGGRDPARTLLEARIQILVDEAMATSALEGVVLDRREVRMAVLRRMAMQKGQASYEETLESMAMLKVLAIGQREVEAGLVEPARTAFKQIRSRKVSM